MYFKVDVRESSSTGNQISKPNKTVRHGINYSC